jgi:predicted metal-dependent hydrolase
MSDTVVQIDGRAKAYRPLPVSARAEAVHAGMTAYEDGEFFEAHEAWEPAWMGTDDVAERALLQGLIKVAAADVHGLRGNVRGVATNLTGALERLEAARAAGRRAVPGATIDLDALIAAVALRLGRARAGESTPPIPIAWERP